MASNQQAANKQQTKDPVVLHFTNGGHIRAELEVEDDENAAETHALRKWVSGPAVAAVANRATSPVHRNVVDVYWHILPWQ